MSKIIYKISSCVLAVLVLLSTFSFTIEKHYCGPILVDVSIVSAAKDCGMKMMNHGNNTEAHAEKKSCCNNEITFLQGQDDLKTQYFSLEFKNPTHNICCDIFSFDQFNLDYKVQTVDDRYIPPDIVIDIQILHEVYLI